MTQNIYDALADWLDSEALEIREIEKRADSALHEKNDDSAYRELMQLKAMRLAELAKNAGPHTMRMDNEAVLSRIEQFSASASTALNIGSVFFMSVLLYPEDYSEGEKNDLEKFADSVRRFG